MKFKNLIMYNGDMFEGGTLDIPPDILGKFIKITYEGGKCGYIDPDCIVSFDEDTSPSIKLVK